MPKVLAAARTQVLCLADALGVRYGGALGAQLLWIADTAMCPEVPLRAHRPSQPPLSLALARSLSLSLSLSRSRSLCRSGWGGAPFPSLGRCVGGAPFPSLGQLPLGWEEFLDERTQTPYYRCLWTGECIWQHPHVAALRGVAEAASELVLAAEADGGVPPPPLGVLADGA